jgi:hypothetical protein
MTAGIYEGNTRGQWLINLTISPAIVAANTTATQTFTLPGLKTTDFITDITKPTLQAGLGIVGYRITALDTLAIDFSNNTGAGITPTAGETYLVGVCRPDSVTLPTSLPR